MSNLKVVNGMDIIEVVDHKSGEILSTEKHTKIKIAVEEDYIKLYLRTISAIHGLPVGLSGTMNEILKRINYENEIVLVSSIKKRIAHSLGIKQNTVDHHLGDLVKRQIIFRVDPGVFKLNTYIFGRGKWADIIKHRETLGIDVEFKEDGHGKTEVIWKTAPVQLKLDI
jgi:methyl coenzyme M reductase gamma subunit